MSAVVKISLPYSRNIRREFTAYGDFGKTLKLVRAGDFVYLDPPYAVNSRRIFREYGKEIFTTADIPRLADCLIEICNVEADFLSPTPTAPNFARLRETGTQCAYRLDVTSLVLPAQEERRMSG